MATTNKPKTNDQLLKALFKEIFNDHPFMSALLRERLQKISEMTRDSIAKNPKSFDNPMIDHTWFIALCDIIDKHLGVDGKEPV